VAGASSTASDFYALLASAVSAAASSSAPTSASQSRDPQNPGALIPPTVQGEERLTFIAAQRERLSFLLSALDKEATTLQGHAVKSPTSRESRATHRNGHSNFEEEDTGRPLSAVSSRKSEVDFVKIDAESGMGYSDSGVRPPKRTHSTGSWMPWSWGVKQEGIMAEDTVMSEGGTEDKGKSSSVEL
jgi:receptor expression-enhancing protein 1/2/3/4